MSTQPQTGTPYTPPHPVKVAGGTPAWKVALHARSVAANQKFGLPRSKPPAPPRPTAPSTPVFDPRNPATWGAGLGSQQLSDIVRTQIGDAINPQVTGLKQQQGTYDQQQLGYQNSLTGYYKALAGILQGESPAVSSAYNSAAGTIGDIGKGLTGAAGSQMQAQNAADQAILARGGQTQAADYMAAKANPGESALNPFYSEHGAIPATSLATQGAAKAAEAALTPGVWAAHGRDALTEAISKAVAGDKEFQQKIQDIYTQVPGLRDKILTQVQDFETQQRQLKDTEVSLGIKNQATQAGIQAKVASYRLQQQKLTADIAHWNAQLQDSSLDRQSRQTIAAQSRAAQAKLVTLRAQEQKDVALWKKQNGIGAGSTGAKPASTAQRQKWMQLADDFYHGLAPRQRYDTYKGTFVPVPGTGKPPVRYPAALAKLMSIGATRAQAIAILNTFYAPGEGGRGISKADKNALKNGVGVSVVTPDGKVNP